MRYVVVVRSSPSRSTSQNALCFTRALLESEHTVSCVFFYGDGVLCANSNACPPQDEFDITHAWASLLKEFDQEGLLCIGAGLRRGMLDDDEAKRYEKNSGAVLKPFVLVGLGDLIEASSNADRVITFQ